MRHCGCCGRDVPESEWDGLYTCCHGCAFCSSLEHFEPCHHGECREAHAAGGRVTLAEILDGIDLEEADVRRLVEEWILGASEEILAVVREELARAKPPGDTPR